jgi:hypothetical protein
MTRIIRKIFFAFAGMITVLGLAAVALPAQAEVIGAGDCTDGADWSWKISNPAGYQASDHEAVVGLSEARRTVTLQPPAACDLDSDDRWQVFNGYFSAEGDGGSLTDTVNVEVPTSNSVAGDDLLVRLRVNEGGTDLTPWEVDKSSSVPRLNLLRRTLFKHNGVDGYVNAFPEPYTCGENEHGASTLIRASWSSHKYFGYAGRTVRWESRPDSGSYGVFIDSDVTNDQGQLHFDHVFAGGDCLPAWVLRGHYGGNGTSSGAKSNGDRIVLVV